MRSLLKLIFIITLLELFVGGGGRVFEIGGATLRILLFFLNIVIVSVLYVYRAKIPKYVVVLVASVLCILLFYAVLGWFNGAPFALIAEDVKPLSYFFSILFFSYFIDSKERVQLIVSLIQKTSLFMALAYIGIQLLFFLGKISFLPFYEYVNTKVSSSDFIFRGTQGLFFYKGFLYMVVGLIFWIHSKNSQYKGISILILMTAMILTGTRGFILMFGLLYALFYGIPLLLKLNIKVLILVAVLVLGSVYFFGNFELGDKDLSDSIRIQQLIQVTERINPISFFIGHGFGIGVPVREVHMEIGYLEVFHKQGVLGLSLWGLLFIILYNTYIREKNFLEIRKPFFLAVLFVILLSLTNPFFNNPIGISLFMIALSAFTALNKTAKRDDSKMAVNVSGS
ncbi:hypothetical protein FK220_007020 [Flavobacteriaceae bacterium TP-CH-4]|uniref:O-antigen ligase n=1 Tax=Pelagihabitans pacificus TaxID=2696054 RepID=A0A967ARK4_9FLAO|nr:hypothetical protein [Pelagihabitans pacificus]NHF59084.1 hypothetical protein [Pelagihabitans pacificus]